MTANRTINYLLMQIDPSPRSPSATWRGMRCLQLTMRGRLNPWCGSFIEVCCVVVLFIIRERVAFYCFSHFFWGKSSCGCGVIMRPDQLLGHVSSTGQQRC